MSIRSLIALSLLMACGIDDNRDVLPMDADTRGDMQRTDTNPSTSLLDAALLKDAVLEDTTVDDAMVDTTTDQDGQVAPDAEPSPENTIESCSDGMDNDLDGFTDCVDFDCQQHSICQENTNATCSDGIDNDGDGFTDCVDFNCQRTATVTLCQAENTNATCSDGSDNDGDGFVDCADSMCRENPEVTLCQP